MIVWTAINSAAILLVMLALYLTIRQVGLLLTHLGPGGARSSDVGPRIGENVSPHVGDLLGGAAAPGRPTLFIFAAPFCPACKRVREAAEALARPWAPAARLVMVYDGLPPGDPAGARGDLLIAAHPTLRENLDVRAVPFAVMTDAAGVVIGHGLVNNASHVESLLEIHGSTGAPGRANGAAGGALPGPAEVQRARAHA